MKLENLLAELEAAAAVAGIKVSYEALAETVSGGGLCRVKGTYRVIIDKRSTVGEKIATLGRALATVAPANLNVSDAAREVVDRYASLVAARAS